MGPHTRVPRSAPRLNQAGPPGADPAEGGRAVGVCRRMASSTVDARHVSSLNGDAARVVCLEFRVYAVLTRRKAELGMGSPKRKTPGPKALPSRPRALLRLVTYHVSHVPSWLSCLPFRRPAPTMALETGGQQESRAGRPECEMCRFDAQMT